MTLWHKRLNREAFFLSFQPLSAYASDWYFPLVSSPFPRAAPVIGCSWVWNSRLKNKCFLYPYTFASPLFLPFSPLVSSRPFFRFIPSPVEVPYLALLRRKLHLVLWLRLRPRSVPPLYNSFVEVPPTPIFLVNLMFGLEVVFLGGCSPGF